MDELLGSLPSCAWSCFLEATNSSSCPPTDINCVCGDTELYAQLEGCVLQSCPTKGALTTKKFAYTICEFPTTDDDHVYPIVNIVTLVFAIIAVLLRVAGRLIGSRIGADDCAIIGALLGAIAIAAIGVELGRSGLGKDVWMLSFDQITRTVHLFFIAECLYVAIIAMIKCSMLLLYLRLFPDEKFRLAARLTLAFTACWGVAMFLPLLFGCQPLNYAWHMWDSEVKGKCINQTVLGWTQAVINVILDFIIIGLPIPTLIKLNISLGKKLGVLFMFTVGLVVTIISILRFTTFINFSKTENPTKGFIPVAIWSLLEIGIGIVCACMPGIRAFFNYTWQLLTDKLSVYGSSRSESKTTSRAPHSQPSPQINGATGEFFRLQEIDSSKM